MAQTFRKSLIKKAAQNIWKKFDKKLLRRTFGKRSAKDAEEELK
jgi:hypothetical protein